MTDDDIIARRLAVTLAQAGHALPEAPADAVGAARQRLIRRRRRTRLATAATLVVVAVATALTAAGPYLAPRPDPPAQQSAGDEILRVWALSTARHNGGLIKCIDRFNNGSDTQVELSTFGSDAYQMVMSGPALPDPAPDVFENWGGTEFARAVDGGRVADLTGAAAGRSDLFLPDVLDGAKVGGRLYGLPMTGVQPIMLFYHKGLFADAGLNPPRTFAELLTAVDAFKARDVTPIALAGGARWPALMYLMYLTDRLGGPGVFADIRAGRPGAWQHPAVREAAGLTQQLVRRGAFGPDANALEYDSGSTSRMLHDGRAAMQLMGSWEYGIQLADDPAFATIDLGYVPFPAVAGGAGNPADVVGVPANYFSVDADSPHRDDAVDFVVDTLTSDQFIDGLLAAGEVPAVRDLESRLAGQPHATFARFTHRLATAAPAFTLAWDQALSYPVAAVLLERTRELIQLEITPEQFVAAMAAAA
ncbi:extracellular solute-binding protein [Jidongwangia harbinensis]|uniref:extracellular solute-binding protein n=1 Tax=Jidongwangia harbinensis TaxID=2878561 RepID=UPI001CD99B3F|nr:extracellular solute-binding protein [Jidongwangia harbinensis]MCA2213937.1 extracellular solute-binding protein [Jidongwangia harbinensis]